MQYRVLGPLEVWDGEQAIPLGGPKQRLVLANLLIRYGQVVPTDRLINDVWAGDQPQAVRVSLQSYVSNLRRSLGSERIERRPPGYVLHVDPDEVDALRFRAALQDARRALTDDPTQAAEVLEEGFALWRGPAFADLRDEPSLQTEVALLDEMRASALEDRIEAELALGRHAELVGELETLIAERPLRERLWSLLMVALYRSDRQAEALAACRRVRTLLLDELGIDPSPDLQRLEQQILQQDPTLDLSGVPRRVYQPPSSLDGRTPYKGLLPFDETDAEDFFGRQELVAELVARLAEDVHGHRLLGVVGPSGSGKSSVVRAGLIPALRAGGLPGSENWFVVEIAPGRRPFDELGAALRGTVVDPPSDLIERLERDEDGLVAAADRLLPAQGSELVLIIDQFEELFTLVEDEGVRDRFLTRLARATRDPRSRLRIVITLRADFYDRPLAYQGFGELLGRRTHTVTPLTPRQLVKAIAGPAERVGVAVDPALVAEAVAEFSDRPGALPLLEYALTESFEHRDGHDLTLQAYLAIGGLSGALARRAEGIYEGVDATGKECIRQTFLRLVAIGEGSVETRRRVLRAELASIEFDGRPIDSVVDALGASRLVSFDRDPVTRGPTVELAHEALLRGWERLAAWVDDARSDLRIHQVLEEDAARWDGSGRDPSFLLRGSRLEQADAWSSRTSLVPTAATREYVEVSFEQREADRRIEGAQRAREGSLRRRSVIRLRALVAVLAVGAMVAGSLAVVAQERGHRAERETRVATARELAAEAVANIGVDAERSLVLALEAVETTYRVDGASVPEAEEALHLALQADRLLYTIPGYRAQFDAAGTRLLVVGGQGLQEGGDTPVRIYDAKSGEVLREATGGGRGDAVFSFDGRRFATSDWDGDGHTYVWDTASGDRIARLGSVAGLSLHFSPDGRLLAFRGSDDETYVFEIGTGEKVNQVAGMDPLAFSPESDRLLIGDVNWDAPTAPVVVDPAGPTRTAHVMTLAGGRQGDGVRTGAWSPDGSSVATLTPSRIVVWNARTGDERFTILPPSGSFTSVAFGPDSLLATGMGNGTAMVWSLSGGSADALLTIGGHASEVESVSFSADGTRLATASDDGDVNVWDVRPEGAHESVTIPGSNAVSFSPDGEALVAGSEEGTIVIYAATTGESILRVSGRSGSINAIEFDPSGSLLVSAGSDGTARLVDATTGAEVWSVPDAPSESPGVLDVGFSPDGRSVATATFASDEPVDLWDVGTGDHLRALPYDIYDANAGHAVGFSSDGRFVAGSGFTFVSVWSLSDDGHVQIETGVVNALDFSPDGSLLVTGANDGSLRLWDPTTGQGVASASGNLGEVTDVAFSPDGASIATSSSDGTVRLWRVRTLEPVITLATDAAGISETTDVPVGKVAFDPDGTRLAYTAEDGMVRVLVLRVDDLIRLAEARLARS